MSIDLVALAGERQVTSSDWNLGKVHHVDGEPQQLAESLSALTADTNADALLLWDAALGVPDSNYVATLLNQKLVDVWHAGLQLGLGGQPELIDCVVPTWMLNRDPSPEIEATSWRVSLRACLIRTCVLRQLGGPDPRFLTLEGASLELGHRYASRGVFTRSVTSLVPHSANRAKTDIPLIDQLRFVDNRFGRRWSYWALMRTLLNGSISPVSAFRAMRQVARTSRPPQYRPYVRPIPRSHGEEVTGRVSVLIPTLHRYPYLRTVLRQLDGQTVKPFEILVIDQTSAAERDQNIAQEFSGLPLTVRYLDKSGQCSSRNLGLQIARGEYVLFLDDDDEVEPDLIERHLRHITETEVQVSCGVAHEAGAGPLPEEFTFRRVSDVFPTNNCLIRHNVLRKSGLFDLAYERGQRADGDLGMRVYLSGALMALSPDISVFHHHAPLGGLRAHKARVITYASSRQLVSHRHLPSVSEIYLAERFFSPRQVREMLWQRAFATLSLRGPLWKRSVKTVLGIALMPHTILQIRRRHREARHMLNEFPQIPPLRGEAA